MGKALRNSKLLFASQGGDLQSLTPPLSLPQALIKRSNKPSRGLVLFLRSMQIEIGIASDDVRSWQSKQRKQNLFSRWSNVAQESWKKKLKKEDTLVTIYSNNQKRPSRK